MRRSSATLGLCSLLLTVGCAQDVAVRAVAPVASVSPPATPCAETGGYVTDGATNTSRYDTPEQAAAAYHGWQGQFDVLIAVPKDGYVVQVSQDGRSALMRSGDVEFDALKDDTGWRIERVRACG